MNNNKLNTNFTYLVDPKLGPFYNEVKTHIDNFVIKYKLLDLSSPVILNKLHKTDFSFFVVSVWPLVKNKEFSEVLAEFVIWVFLYDDWFEKKRDLSSFRKTNRKLFDIMNGKQFTNDENIYVNSFNEFFQNLKKFASEGCLQRFSKNLKASFIAEEEELKARRNGEFDSVGHYIQIRRATVVVMPCFNLIELFKEINYEAIIANGNEEKLNKLLEIADDHVSYSNDYFSYAKEKVDGDIANLVDVYRRHNNCSEAEAFKYTFELIELKNVEFKRLYLTIDDKDLKEYADGVADWMVGHIEWSKMSKRYSEQMFLDVVKDLEAEKYCLIENI